MNSNLKAVQKELRAKKQESMKLEIQERRLKAEPKVERLKNAFLSSDEVCKSLENHTNTEVDIIAKVLVNSFAKTIYSVQDELLKAKAKNVEKAARRKQKETATLLVDTSASTHTSASTVVDNIGGVNRW